MGFAGGLAVYVRDTLDFFVGEVLTSNFFYISVTIRLPPSGVASEFNVHAYYRPPVDANVTDFLAHLVKSIEGDQFGMIAGDVNVDMLAPLKIPSVRSRYEGIIESNAYFLGNDKVTRPESSTLLDHAVFTSCSPVTIYNSTIEHLMSDHNLVLSHVQMPVSSKCTFVTKTVVDYDQVNVKLAEMLDESKVPRTEDVNVLYSYFSSAMKSAVQDFSTTKVVRTKTKHLGCPYMNDHLDYLLRKIANLRMKIKRKRRKRLDYSYLVSKLEVLKVEFDGFQMRYKADYYEDLFKDSRNSKGLWKNVNRVLGKSSHNRPVISLKVLDESIPESQVADRFNEFFSKVGTDLADAIPETDHDDLNSFHTLNANPLSIFFEPVTVHDVSSIILAMDVDKALGFDGMSVLSLKCCVSTISPYLCDLFNLCLFRGVYPDDLKIARVIPVYKKGDAEDMTNYRPISVLPAVNKVLETIVQRALVRFLNSCNFFHHRQYGFREGSGTHTALIELINMINREIDGKKVVSGLFIDLSKAFDTVVHKLLLAKLEMAGVRGVAHKLLRCYLSNRKQCTDCNGVRSDLADVKVGVPQGGVLSPLLFIIFINDFFSLPIESSPFSFADDTNMFKFSAIVAQNVASLSNDLKVVAEYFRLNKLTLNLSKTKLVHFRKPLVRIDDLPSLVFDGVAIEPCSSVKCLGLTVDEFVNWNEHVANVARAVSRGTGIMKKLRFLPRKVLRILYFSMVHSRLTYCVGVWGSANKAVIDELQVLQKKALKAAHKLPLCFPTALLFGEEFPNVLTVSRMYELAVCKYVHCSVHDLKHHSTVFSDNSNRYGTRFSFLLRKPPIQSKYGKRSLQYAGPTLYNALPREIRELKRYDEFSRRLKSYLLRRSDF